MKILPIVLIINLKWDTDPMRFSTGKYHRQRKDHCSSYTKIHRGLWQSSMPTLR